MATEFCSKTSWLQSTRRQDLCRTFGRGEPPDRPELLPENKTGSLTQVSTKLVTLPRRLLHAIGNHGIAPRITKG
jgi:hypothetical protein